MTMLVDLQIDAQLTPADELDTAALQALQDVAAQTMLALGKSTHELSIVITTDEHVAQLNRTYRSVDGPTDVLSFDAEPLPPGVATDEAPYLGDLLLAYPYTLQRALHAGHDPFEEFALLVVHGILHLCGYDHNTAAGQQVMWQKQRDLLRHLDIALDVPDYIHEPDDAP
jgi:probable rRNA maturation factor